MQKESCQLWFSDSCFTHNLHSITYKYPDEVVSKAEEYIENSYFYPNDLNEDVSREITLLSICKLD